MYGTGTIAESQFTSQIPQVVLVVSQSTGFDLIGSNVKFLWANVGQACRGIYLNQTVFTVFTACGFARNVNRNVSRLITMAYEIIFALFLFAG